MTIYYAAMVVPTPASTEYAEWLKTPDGGNCTHIKILDGGFYIAIKPLLFHWTLILGPIGDKECYLDHYCYGDQGRALLGLIQWNGKGDPNGWHRHAKTGRRRPEGNKDYEYVAF